MGLYMLRVLATAQWTVICAHHYSSAHSIFTALKILWALIFHPSLPSTPGNNRSFHCLQLRFFPRMSSNWNLTGCSLLGFFHLILSLVPNMGASSHFSLANISVLIPISFWLGSSTFNSSRNGTGEQVPDFTMSPVHCSTELRGLSRVISQPVNMYSLHFTT